MPARLAQDWRFSRPRVSRRKRGTIIGSSSRKADGTPAYQLAVVVDSVAVGSITLVEEVPGELVVRVGTLACARTLEVSEHRLADVGKFGGGIYWPP